MPDRTLRTALFTSVIICVAMLAGTRIVRAQGAADGGAPAPAATPSVDGGVAPTETAAPPADSGGGLFEQSQTAAAPAAGEPSLLGKAPFTLNGYARGDVFIGKVDGQNLSEMKANYGELSLQLRTAKLAYGDGFADLRVRYGTQGDAASSTYVDLREAYVNTYLGPFDLRLGKQIIVWGRADALNPTNNITPVDFRIRSPLEDDIRLGNVGARAQLRFWRFRLESVWMPTYLPTVLPPVGLPPLVSFGAPTYPSADLRNGLVADRLHLELAAFEVSISHLYGYAPLPGLALSGVTFDMVNPGITVSRTPYQQHVFGFDFSTALGEIATIRGEAAYRRPNDYRGIDDTQNPSWVARPDLQYALGADHNFGSFNVIAQYLGRYVFDWQKMPGTTRDPGELEAILRDPTRQPSWESIVRDEVGAELAQINQILFSQTARVQHIATVRLEWLLAHETLSLSSLCLYNFTTREWLVTPRLGWKLTDTMIAYLGAQIFMGPKDTLFGLIDQTLSAGYAELRFAF
jgi:hypothetical protein